MKVEGGGDETKRHRFDDRRDLLTLSGSTNQRESGEADSAQTRPFDPRAVRHCTGITGLLAERMPIGRSNGNNPSKRFVELAGSAKIAGDSTYLSD